MTAHDPSLPSDAADYDYGLGLQNNTPVTIDPENLLTLIHALEADLGYIRFL